MTKKDKIEKITNILTFIALGLLPLLCAWMGVLRAGAAVFGMFFAFLSFFGFYFLGNISLVKKYALFFLCYSAIGLFVAFSLNEIDYDTAEFFWRMICFSWYACLVWFFLYAIYWVGKTLFGSGNKT